MKTLHTIACATAAAAIVGCTPPRLAPPNAVKTAQELKVEGYKAGTFKMRENDLKIGSYQVTNIDRDWDKGSNTGVGPWSRQSSKKAYRFDVQAQARTIHAECKEIAVENSVGGWGKGKVSLACDCAEGDDKRATVELVNGAGTATIGGVPYELTELHTTDQGRELAQALGYQFRAAQGTGAVDISGTGRAWLPASASEDESLGLVCSYAGFLLYRPTDQ